MNFECAYASETKPRAGSLTSSETRSFGNQNSDGVEEYRWTAVGGVLRPYYQAVLCANSAVFCATISEVGFQFLQRVAQPFDKVRQHSIGK
jgi:hypothetical protein